jgi:hypothetical protein
MEPLPEKPLRPAFKIWTLALATAAKYSEPHRSFVDFISPVDSSHEVRKAEFAICTDVQGERHNYANYIQATREAADAMQPCVATV